MRNLFAQLGRNLRVYSRDRVGLFMSFLSALIMIMLYLLFLGDLQVKNLTDSFPGGDINLIKAFVGSWTLAGVVAISSFSSAVAGLNLYVEDRVYGRFKEFMVSPITRGQLTASYMLTAALVSIMITTFVLIVGGVLFTLRYGVSITIGQYVTTFGYICLLSLFSASFLSFIFTFIKSHGAYAAFASITGALMGFVMGAYLPMGLFSKTVATILNVLPFSPAAMLLREPVAGEALKAISGGYPQAQAALSDFYGFNLYVGNNQLSWQYTVVLLVSLIIVFTVLAALRMRKSIK